MSSYKAPSRMPAVNRVLVFVLLNFIPILCAITLSANGANARGSRIPDFQAQVRITVRGDVISQGDFYSSKDKIRMDLAEVRGLSQTQILDFSSRHMYVIFEPFGFYFEMPMGFNALAPQGKGGRMVERCFEKKEQIDQWTTKRCFVEGDLEGQPMMVQIWRASELNGAVIKTYIENSREGMELFNIRKKNVGKKLFFIPETLKRFYVSGGPREMLEMIKGLLK